MVQLSTGGSVHDPLEQRLTVLDAEPDSCSLTCGTTNFGDDVFLNPWGFMSDLYVQAQEREVVPEFELFDLGHVHALRRLLDTHGLPFGGRVHVDFVTGVPGGMPATTAALMAGVAMLPAEVTSWSATGIGRGHLPIMAASLSAGGHLRVGMEDNVVFARGQVVQHNDELVARAAELATLMQRPPLEHRAGARAARGQGPARALTPRGRGWAVPAGGRRNGIRAAHPRPRCGRRWARGECSSIITELWLPCATLLGSRPSSTRRPPGSWPVGSCSITATALLTGWLWLSAVLAVGFALRVAAGPRYSPLGQLATKVDRAAAGCRPRSSPGRRSASPRPWAWSSPWPRRASWSPGCRS